MVETRTYLFTCGEYSSFGHVAYLEGPVDVDLPALAQEFRKNPTKAAKESLYEGRILFTDDFVRAFADWLVQEYHFTKANCVEAFLDMDFGPHSRAFKCVVHEEDQDD